MRVIFAPNLRTRRRSPHLTPHERQDPPMSATAAASTPPRDLPPGGTGGEAGLGVSRLWRRELAHYPAFGPRLAALSIVVLTTILFYYQYYLISGVSEQVLTSTGVSFLFF